MAAAFAVHLLPVPTYFFGKFVAGQVEPDVMFEVSFRPLQHAALSLTIPKRPPFGQPLFIKSLHGPAFIL
jgi:hypothetical protein